MTTAMLSEAAARSAAELSSGLATQTMRAAVVTAPGAVEVRDVSVPHPKPDEILVTIEGCGVCASNIPPWEGREWFTYPLNPGQLGHEAWGRIVAVGQDVIKFSPGERVAVLSQGGYAEYDVAHQDQAVLLPDMLLDEPFPAEPLGCAMNIFRRSEMKAGQTVAIVGIGFLGAILTRLASTANARVIAISRRPFSLELASQMGAATTIPMDDHWRIIEHVRQLTGGQFCDVVVECVGKEWPVNLSAEITRERGRLVIAGYHQDGLRSVNMQLWNWRGLDVINAHERDPKVYLRGMREAVDAVSNGDLDPRPLYTHKFPLDRLADALNMTKDRPDGFVKALVML
jgi:threonine dehydrogenase-like Zn-dependent dehydrogenase